MYITNSPIVTYTPIEGYSFDMTNILVGIACFIGAFIASWLSGK